MSKQLVVHPERYLDTGQAVSISALAPGEEVAAAVIKISPEDIWLQLAQPAAQLSFATGDRVRIKYWDKVAVYHFDTKVLQIWGGQTRHVSVARPTVGVLLERRISFRVRSPIPISFTIISASQPQLVGQKVTGMWTEDLGLGGLKFEAQMPLRRGDQLEISLHLPEYKSVNAVGWVVRAEPAGEGEQYLNSVAVRFLQLDSEDQKQLLQFLSQSETVS